MRAFQALADLHPHWHLALVGNGPEQSSLQAEAENAGLQNRVHFIGHTSHIQSWYERADIYISTSQFEGSPNTLLEAMACRCACLAYDCETGPAEIIEHGQNGILVSDQDQEDLIAQLKALIGDETLRAHLQANADNVLDRFSDDKFFSAWTHALTRQG